MDKHTVSPRAARPSALAQDEAAAAPKGQPTRPLHPQVIAAQPGDVLVALLVFRFVNSLVVRTFFQPDEYFQALEPAWDVAFGHESGAWLTWEWRNQLRSSLHPLLFGALYKAADGLTNLLMCDPPFKAVVLAALPKVVQSVFAALGDFYAWRLATAIHGGRSNAPWATWYCSTRTFSNSLETTLTIAALYYWPWEVLGDGKQTKTKPLSTPASVSSLRASLVLAAIAVLLRPTNIFIWLSILTLTLTRFTLDGVSPLSTSSLVVLVREIIMCGSSVLAVSVLSDRYYFGFWTFPPYQFLHFNLSQSLSVFYGSMPWHYYLSQGIPLLSTTFLPFVLLGLWKSTASEPGQTNLQSNILKTISFAVLTMVGVLSILSHKEVRFIYPLLPILHILAGPYLVSFFTTQEPSQPNMSTSNASPPTVLRHKIFLANILSINILLAGYLSVFHQPAAVSVTGFLRTEFERLHENTLTITTPVNTTVPDYELFALFLTPCHSTPWRSHLIYPSLRARALTCEPPLHTAPGSVERAEYLDEADRFYLEDPITGRWGLRFLEEEMWPPLPNGRRGGEVPRFIVGFEGIEPVLQDFFRSDDWLVTEGVRLTRVWAGWNGLFNEDWRRQGRLVVWDTRVYTKQ
ncbi:hypothetical protein GQ53DRAFT_642138 [Thozetella sp. PMI_491]|nr:hypothetical protein GQ53DRAFT_642138 [Thozetella sp. PMI_491]